MMAWYLKRCVGSSQADMSPRTDLCETVKPHNRAYFFCEASSTHFGVAVVTLSRPRVAVAVGLLNAYPLKDQGMPNDFRRHIRRCLSEFKVRLFTGIFPNCCDDSKLCRTIFRAGAACRPLQRCFASGNGSLYAWPHRLVVLGPVTQASPFIDEHTSWADFCVTHSSFDNADALEDMYAKMESVRETAWPDRARARMQEEPLLSNCQVSFQHSHGFCPQILLSVGEDQAT